MKTKGSIENVLVVIFAILAFIIAGVTDNAGMPQKWHTVIFATLVPFGAIISIKRLSWPRLTFWMSLSVWFVIHLLLVCLFFGVVLANVTTFGFLWWLPVAFIEVLALLGLQPALEKKLRAERTNGKSKGG
jgi:hypothetical protein